MNKYPCGQLGISPCDVQHLWDHIYGSGGHQSLLFNDLRLAWRLCPDIEVSLVGQNLLDGLNKEFTPSAFEIATEVPRTVYGQIKWRM